MLYLANLQRNTCDLYIYFLVTEKKATKRKSKVQAESETSDSDVEDYEEFDDEEEEPEEEDDGNEMETEMLNYMAPEAALEQGDPT